MDHDPEQPAPAACPSPDELAARFVSRIPEWMKRAEIRLVPEHQAIWDANAANLTADQRSMRMFDRRCLVAGCTNIADHLVNLGPYLRDLKVCPEHRTPAAILPLVELPRVYGVLLPDTPDEVELAPEVASYAAIDLPSGEIPADHVVFEPLPGVETLSDVVDPPSVEEARDAIFRGLGVPASSYIPPTDPHPEDRTDAD